MWLFMPNDKLNPSQHQAVQYGSGPLLIVAGAGTGKTTVLLERMKWLMQQKKVNPDSILALTFTEKAAREMLERLDLMMPLGYEEPWISTFHSFGDRLLREEGLEIGLSPGFDILTNPQAYILFKKNLFDFKLKYFLPLGNPTKFIQAILSFFSRAQDEDVSATEFEQWVSLLEKKNQTANASQEKASLQRWQELAETYRQWQEIKTTENVLDFGDLIVYTLRLFRERPNILAKYQQKFRYILVDEFQDTNFAQLKLIKLLAPPEKKPNLLVVGDDFQAIYKWRGAAVSNIMDFTQHYPEAKTIILRQNYRSTQPLLDHSYQFIKHNEPETLEVKLKIDKKLTAVNKAKIVPEIYQLTTLEAEADFVADKILELAAKKEYTYRDFAILARANNHLDPFVAALKRRGMPYQLVGNRGLFDQPEVRDLTFLSRLLVDPKDSTTLFQVLHLSIFNLPAGLILDLLNQSRAVRQNLWEYISYKLQVKSFKLEDQEKLEYVVNTVEKYRGQLLDKPASRLLYDFIWESKFLKDYLDQDSLTNQLAVKNLNLFFNQIKSFENQNERTSLVDFVDWLEMLLEAGENPAQAEIEDIDTVNLVTVHSAKGLEWPAVFVVNAVKDRFPTRHRTEPIEFPDELAGEELPKGDSHLLEERRLFYVACTRAKNELFITLAKDYGGKSEKKPSSFIPEFGLKVKEPKASQSQMDLFSPFKTLPKIKAPTVINGRLRLNYISYSQLDVYQTCPLKYKYRYVLNVPTKPHHAYTFGTSIHETLRYFHTFELKSQRPTKDDLLFFYQQNFQKEGYESEKHRQQRYQDGQQFLVKYFENYREIFKGKPVKLEQRFRVMLGQTPLVGKIDRIDKLPDGSYELIDYKTGQAKDQKAVDKDAQLTIYNMAAKWALGITPKNLCLFFIEAGQKVDTTRTDDQLKKKFEQMQTIVEEIIKSDFKATPGYPMPCHYCEYKRICPFAKKG
jgi:DNA helicase-2/ATP-dependent DNA helicase PcrA